MLIDILLLLAGLALLLAGGSFVTDGATAIARRLGVPPLIIGLTIVAFGSSAPDLAVCIISTMHGKTTLAMGDVVGACNFDLLLAVGMTALIHPVMVSRTVYRGDIPLVIVAAAALFLTTGDRLLDGADYDVVTRTDGLFLLLLYILFMAYSIVSGRQRQKPHDEGMGDKPKMKMWVAALAIIGGLGALTGGGQLIVNGASGIARAAGWSEALIGITIVAVGSSLPDLATSLIAAAKHQPGIALGNLFGSCAFDMLVCIGASSMIRPLSSAGITTLDYGVMLGAAILLGAVALGRKHTFTRPLGALLCLAYVGYITLLVIRG